MNDEHRTNKHLITRLANFECRDATCHHLDHPIVLDKARGSILWDVEHRPYIDLCAGFGALPIGHNHPEIQSALKANFNDEAPTIIHGLGDVYPSRHKVALFEKLASMLPTELSKGMLAVTGAGAVEAAMKTAMLATKKSNFIAFEGGYHGLDFGSLAATWRQDFKAPFLEQLATQRFSHLPYNSKIETIRSFIASNELSGKIAGIIVEPVQGRGGTCLPRPGWLEELRRLCDEQNAALIYDEIYTGLGRTGTITTAEKVSCDLLCLGKALGGGLPLSACFGTQEMMDSWPKSTGEALHTGTFFGHPLACQVGLETLNIIEKQELEKRAAKLGAETLERMNARWRSTPGVRALRGKGLMLCIEFDKPGAGERLMEALRKRGVIAIPSGPQGRCLSITPALNIERSLLFEALDIINTCMTDSGICC